MSKDRKPTGPARRSEEESRFETAGGSSASDLDAESDPDGVDPDERGFRSDDGRRGPDLDPGATPVDGQERARPSSAGLTAEAEGDRLSEGILEELRELGDLRDRHLRLMAEFENYRKRTRRELGEVRDRGQSDLAAALLEVLDDLGRVAETPAEATTVEALREGVELVDRKLRKKLEDAGLAPVPAAEGDRFDPSIHEAVVTAAVDDPALDDRIGRVFSPGYLFGDRLLRPAQVEVQKHRDAGPHGGGDHAVGGKGDGSAGDR